MINEILTFKNPIVDISFPEIEKFDKLPDPTAQGPTAFVSIMEGCSQYCSYCVVPYTRGEEIHRPFEDILHEVAVLTQQGVREITLLGQNVNAYQGTLPTGQPADLALLIQYLAEFDTLDRIRFMTSHPLAFTERLLAAYAEIPKLADHLHLPVQSGSDRILMQMKRGHTTQAYREKIQHLRQIRPHISLTSDFIVGFPGETDADFQETLDFVQEMNFDQSFCFIYSKRPGTLAAAYADTVSQDIKKARLAQLQALLHQQALRFSQNLHHTVQDVLVLHAAKKHPGQLTGRTTHNRMVHFTGGSSKLIGSMTRVCITETMANILKGEWVDH
jgi:tRNA-2-methylthio-N6-dimethylallyladenosine synthase